MRQFNAEWCDITTTRFTQPDCQFVQWSTALGMPLAIELMDPFQFQDHVPLYWAGYSAKVAERTLGQWGTL